MDDSRRNPEQSGHSYHGSESMRSKPADAGNLSSGAGPPPLPNRSLPAGAPPSVPDLPPRLSRPRFQRRSRRVTVLIVIGILLGVIGGLALLALYVVNSTDRPDSMHEAERFVRFVCLGEEGEESESEDPTALCGYAKAYDMLSENMRSGLSYPSFCERFEFLCDRNGSIQRFERKFGRRRRRRRPAEVRYLLYLGPIDRNLEDLSVFALDLRIGWVDDKWVVNEFQIERASHRELR